MVQTRVTGVGGRFYDCLTARAVRSERSWSRVARNRPAFSENCGLLLLVASALLALSREARAGDFPVSVDCSTWSPETVAQVEARVRTMLLAEGLSAQRVAIACQGNAVAVEVETELGKLARPVARRSARVEDDVVAAVEAAVRGLLPAAEPAAPAAEPETPSAPPAAPTPAPPPAPAPAAALPAPTIIVEPRRDVATIIELQANALVERWSNNWSWGGEGGLSVGDERSQYGLALGGRAVTGEPATFDISEWNASARFASTFPRLGGLRGRLGVGASLFVTTPAPKVTSESPMLLGAAYLELAVSRPFWFGAFGVSPMLGVRVFSAPRNVRVNGDEELVLPLAVPQLALSLVYRR